MSEEINVINRKEENVFRGEIAVLINAYFFSSFISSTQKSSLDGGRLVVTSHDSRNLMEMILEATMKRLQ